MNTTHAETKRVNLVSDYFRRAYDDEKKVVYVNSLVPSEIILSFGAVPFNMGSVGGIFAQARATTNLINAGEQQFLSSDLCATSRCLVGAAHSDALPTPEFLVLTSGPCDVDSHLLHVLSRIYGKEWFLIDLPLYSHDEEQALAYLEGQLRKLVTALEVHLKVPFDPHRLNEAIANGNQTLTYIEAINAMASRVPCPMSVVETIDIIASLHLLGTPELRDVYREKLEELAAKEPLPAGSRKRKPRVMWHWLRTYYSNEIFEHLQDRCNLDVISEYDVMGVGFYGWEPIDPERPFRSLARRLLRGSANYSLSTQGFARILPERSEAFSLDGVISFSPRGCRHLVSMGQVLRDVFGSQRLPFLEVDCDCIDDRDYSFSQIKTRLDAFAELLHERIAS